MKTSYFGNKAVVDNSNAVSIARWPPRWWGSRRRYIILAPPIDLLNRYKAGLTWPEYVREYKRDVLSKLDPVKVLTDLGDESILLCWEKPSEYCHRRLVAEWLANHLNIKVPEF